MFWRSLELLMYIAFLTAVIFWVGFFCIELWKIIKLFWWILKRH